MTRCGKIRFSSWTITEALIRQGFRGGANVQCAMCGHIINAHEEYWNTDNGCYIIPKKIIGSGIKKIDNCIVVCPECYRKIEIRFNDNVIPIAELPFYGIRPKFSP